MISSRLANPTALITGASTGIGRTLSLVMAREGYDLGLIARRDDLLRDLQKELFQKFPARKIFVAAGDVAQENSLREAFEKLMHQLGSLDVFIANAGVGASTPAWQDCWKETKQILEVNFVGTVHSLELAKQIMLRQKRGHLVGISSVAAGRGLPQSSAYCSSKAGLATYLESLRLDLKGEGIKVTSIHPGFIATPMTDKRQNKMPFLLSVEVASEKIYWAIKSRKSRFVFPWQMRFLYPWMQMAPDFLYDFFLSFKKRKTGILP